MKVEFAALVAFCIGLAMFPAGVHAQAISTEKSDRAAQGRAATERLKSLARANKISLVDYYKKYHEIDMAYFNPPSAIIDLNLYHIMLAKMVEDRRISIEEFDYYSNKKTAEAAEKLVAPLR